MIDAYGALRVKVTTQRRHYGGEERLKPSGLKGSMRRGVLGAVFLLGAAFPMQAQRLSGTVVESDGSTPASYVALLVVDSVGNSIARGETGAAGTFAFVLSAPGRYAVRALRVGYRPTVTPLVLVGTDSAATLRIQLAGHRIVLPAVRVSERSACSSVQGSGSSALIETWDQARAALLGVAQSQPSSRVRLESVSWSVIRDIWPDTGTIRTIDNPRRVSGDAFRSRPAHELLRTGFVRNAGDSVEFHAPDAFVLLDPAFAATYCFWLQPGPADHPEWVGLGVTAAQPDVERVTIEGVLWLTREGALVRFDYRYVGLDNVLQAADPGGQVEFERLPTGQWIVSRWVIRMPQLVTEMQKIALRSVQTPFKRLSRIVERGAMVTRAEYGNREFVEVGTRPLQLTVQSRAGAADQQPIAGTVVWLPSMGLQWVVDTAQAVAVDRITPGRHRFLLQTPLMRDVGITPDPVDITLMPEGATFSATLMAPTPTEVRRRLCPGIENDAIAVGVLSPTNRSGFTTLYVSRSTEVDDSTKAPSRRIAASADTSGRWRACGVPRGVTLALWGEREGRRQTLVRFRVSRSVDLALVAPFQEQVFATAPALAAQGDGEEPGRLVVRVLSARDSTPVPNAQVVTDDSLVGRADSRGEFRLADAPEGTYAVMVRSLGYTPVTRSLTVSSERALVDTVYLERLPPLLSEVVIRGRTVRAPTKYVDVLRRAASGWGTVFTREDIRGAADVKSVLASIPGVRANDRGITFQRCQGELPSPASATAGATIAGGPVPPRAGSLQLPPAKVQVYIDGVRVTANPAKPVNDPAGGATDDAIAAALKLVNPSDIEFMEVYRGVGQIPVEFLEDACAVIAIWTRAY